MVAEGLFENPIRNARFPAATGFSVRVLVQVFFYRETWLPFHKKQNDGGHYNKETERCVIFLY